MKVLLAVDGSDYTKRMLGWVAAHEELIGGESDYTVLAVVSELPRRGTFLDAGDSREYYAEAAEEVLQPVRRFIAQKGWKTVFAQAVGQPADEIAALANREHFDLIVLGSHGHTALGNVALGSVAIGVLARCKTPLLLIR